MLQDSVCDLFILQGRVVRVAATQLKLIWRKVHKFGRLELGAS